MGKTAWMVGLPKGRSSIFLLLEKMDVEQELYVNFTLIKMF